MSSKPSDLDTKLERISTKLQQAEKLAEAAQRKKARSASMIHEQVVRVRGVKEKQLAKLTAERCDSLIEKYTKIRKMQELASKLRAESIARVKDKYLLNLTRAKEGLSTLAQTEEQRRRSIEDKLSQKQQVSLYLLASLNDVTQIGGTGAPD
jgi:hypothetical protein